MVVSDIVEEEASLPAKNITINSGDSTTLEVPFLAAIVGEEGIGVVEVGDHDD